MSPADQSGRLSDETVAVAALAVLDSNGPGALSFRRVASKLGVSHMAVHRYCGSFEGLLDLCAEHLAASLPEVDPNLPWAVSTEMRFTALYQLLSGHWGLVALQGGRPWMGPNMTRRFSEPAVASSLAVGLSPTDVTNAHRELFVYSIGCALTRAHFNLVPDSEYVKKLEWHDHRALSEHRDELLGGLRDYDLFIHGLRTLIASWDPQSGYPR